MNFKLKDGLPETTIACGGAACTNDWVKGPVSVSLAATDGGGGLGATRYTLDGSDPSPSSPQYTGPFTLTATTTVKFRTWDLAGQPETVKSQLLKIDAVAPTASITSPANGSNLQGDVTVNVDATDQARASARPSSTWTATGRPTRRRCRSSSRCPRASSHSGRTGSR